MLAPRMSRQLALYLRAREYGHGRADAAAYAGIGIGEAELHDRERGWDAPADNLITTERNAL